MIDPITCIFFEVCAYFGKRLSEDDEKILIRISGLSLLIQSDKRIKTSIFNLEYLDQRSFYVVDCIERDF